MMELYKELRSAFTVAFLGELPDYVDEESLGEYETGCNLLFAWITGSAVLISIMSVGSLIMWIV